MNPISFPANDNNATYILHKVSLHLYSQTPQTPLFITISTTMPKCTTQTSTSNNIHLITIIIIIMPLLLPSLLLLFPLGAVLYVSLAVSLVSAYFAGRRRPVYLVNFSCYRPDDSSEYSHEEFVARAVELGTFTPENVEFQRKILERSGVGGSTYFPASVARIPPDLTIVEARKEGEMVMFGAIDEVLRNTPTVRAEDVDVLVVNCSLFGPTPSLAEMVVNRYKLKEDVFVYNLSGMGCSAGMIAIDVASQLLKVHSNSCALIVSTENITLNGYYGNKRPMLVTNCLFRMGGAAILLSNRRSDRTRSKYVLSHLVRTHNGSRDASYACVRQEEDDEGKRGVSLSKDLMSVAGDALRANITALGPRVLPFSEQLRFLSSLVARKILKMKVRAYVPDFKTAFEHFCIHAGGRAILDELEKSLGLTEGQMEPSRMTLYRFGNTSSSSLWYELAYAEAKGRVRRGDRVWQIAFGSGFKCNSLVWTALRDVAEKDQRWPWADVVDHFPVDVPKVATIAV